MAFEDMQVGAADTACSNLDQRRLLRNFWPGHRPDHRLCTRTLESGNAYLLHEISSGPSAIVDFCCVGTGKLGEASVDANIGVA
jgi:hypothetical protein